MNRITDVVEGRGQYNTKTVFEGTGYALWIGLAHVQLPAPSSDPLQVLGQLVKKNKSPILSDTLEEDIARINKMFAPHPLGGMSREVNAQLFECEAWFASFTDFVYSAIMKGVVYQALLMINPDAFPEDKAELYQDIKDPNRPISIGHRFRDKLLHAIDEVEDQVKKIEQKGAKVFNYDALARKKAATTLWYRHTFVSDMAMFADWARHCMGRSMLETRCLLDMLRRGVETVWNSIHEDDADEAEVMAFFASLPDSIKTNAPAVATLSRILWTDQFERLDECLDEMAFQDKNQREYLRSVLIATSPLRRVWYVVQEPGRAERIRRSLATGQDTRPSVDASRRRGRPRSIPIPTHQRCFRPTERRTQSRNGITSSASRRALYCLFCDR
jgi:hypothetical protein